ncbi:MAG: TonB-dependent receptor [Gammaproteobacteria bacterium]|nr:TonB-dependent receptor [Gammaproteobacteria bacterium]
MTERARKSRKVSARAAVACLHLGVLLAWADEIETITVVGATPASDKGLDVRDFPGTIQTVHADDLERTGSWDIPGYLLRYARGVHINSAQGNPLQSDLYYRGYGASPLLGLPMGLTVYQDGVRLNEPLGDAVNWDLIPTRAIAAMSLLGGSNPLYGLNTLGGSIVLNMKNGFDHAAHAVAVEGGSHGRFIGSVESGANNGSMAYYVNANRFREDGWRDLSPSNSEVLYGNVGWRGEGRTLRIDHLRGASDLTGNGLSPVGLLARDRGAIFTAPDITENDSELWRIGGSTVLGDNATLVAHVHVRDNHTASFNGDGMEEDDIDELINGFGGSEALSAALPSGCRDEQTLDFAAADDDAFEEAVAETGCAAVNNLSVRGQDSQGGVAELRLSADFMGIEHDVNAGIGYYRGESGFDSRVQFALFDPALRSTVAPDAVTGGFADERTHIATGVRRSHVYLRDSFSLDDAWVVNLAGFFHDSEVSLRDRTGERPQLNGAHGFTGFNWSAGVVRRWQSRDLFGSYGQSSRLPTPIELACSEALARNPETGEMEECRLPNAFLADPPLEEVVARSVELGARGTNRAGWQWSMGLFHAYNDNDIIWQTGATRAHGLFRNVDGTRRRGVEASIGKAGGTWRWQLDYSYVVATFDDDFDVLSPNHPANATADDDEADDESPATRPVERGDRIPGIPAHLLKSNLAWSLTERVTIGADMIAASGSHLRGDESNELDELDGYAVVNMRANYRTDRFEAFLLVENLFDGEYENFGLIGEEPDEVVGLDDIGADPFFLGPGAPRSVHLGVKLVL